MDSTFAALLEFEMFNRVCDINGLPVDACIEDGTI